MDHGTENTLVEDIQKAFRWEHTDDMAGEKSVLKGSSHSNQTVVNKYKSGQRVIIYFTTYWPIKRCLRPTVNGHQIVRPGKDKIVSRIERWWRSLRQWCVQNWISLFAGLENDGLFDTSNLAHLEAAKYCFTELIQNDLNRINTAWNSHSIRSCRVSVTSGKPEMMYFMPELFDAVDYMTPVCMEDLEQVIREYSIGCLAGCSEESRKFFDSVLQQNSLPAISDVNSALQIYAILIRS